jgi:hypothetical protein
VCFFTLMLSCVILIFCLFTAGLFGNFLGNNEKQRLEQLNVRRATQSIWSYVFEHKRQFIQENYETYPGNAQGYSNTDIFFFDWLIDCNICIFRSLVASNEHETNPPLGTVFLSLEC